MNNKLELLALLKASKVMVVCEECSENNPEGCGHYSLDDLRETPDGRWLCQGCHDEDTPTDGVWWQDLPKISLAASAPAGVSLKKTYIKPLRTIVEIDARYANQIRDLLNTASAPAGDGGEVETLRSSPSFHADPIEQLAFELAWELEEAELRTNDLVTINRDKLKAIARRMVSRAGPPAPAALECELRQWFNSFEGDHGKTEWESLLAIVARPPAVEVREHTPTSVLDVHPDVAEALTQVFEYFENRSDVRDGDYGAPEPNTEMRLAQMCSEALDRLPALSASPRETNPTASN